MIGRWNRNFACCASQSPGRQSARGRHERLGPRLHVDEAAVVLAVETWDPAHREEVIDALRSAGYTLAFS